MSERKNGKGIRLSFWDPEDEVFWDAEGKSIAQRNLWISIPNLLCGFAVWLYWGMVAKFIQKAHFANPELFDFTFMNAGQSFEGDAYRNLLFTLPAGTYPPVQATRIGAVEPRGFAPLFVDGEPVTNAEGLGYLHK